MKYYYEVHNKQPIKGKVYECNHPMYNKCTLYLEGDVGLAVIQQRFNELLKMTWWGPIDPGLVDDIYYHPDFSKYFLEFAACKDENGLYPTVQVRKLMWALRMKPLKRQFWETK
ncbi:MAG: hypothetical protein J6U54_05345 [Clostridiales bacterium]|nr:hypothetical protein [Clostridiales bacterium]